jgi:hypothetical protein
MVTVTHQYVETSLFTKELLSGLNTLSNVSKIQFQEAYKHQREPLGEKGYLLDVSLAGNLFNLIHGICCLLLIPTGDIYFCTMIQQVLSSNLTQACLYVYQQHSDQYSS